MIPELPSSVSDKERLDFYASLAGNLSDQSTIHVNWHTHRQNPSICWICDLNILISKVLNLKGLNTKSALDIGTRLSSEDDSDSEIELENNLNVNEEAVPEYDTVESDEVELDDSESAEVKP